MATMMLRFVIFFYEIKVTRCDCWVDVAHGLGEPRILLCLPLTFVIYVCHLIEDAQSKCSIILKCFRRMVPFLLVQVERTIGRKI